MNDITVIVCTSVLPSHPSTAIIEETLDSIRHHLPYSEIILQVDGLRTEQQNRKPDYDEYKTRLLWLCLTKYTNVRPVIFEEHSHQTTMMGETIDQIETPLLLYVEHDCPFVLDRKINWAECIDFIKRGHANTIRFHFEGLIPEEHQSLMLKTKGNFLQTIQWSQRPHLSSVIYYKDTVLPVTLPKFFIEDTFHGRVQEDYNLHGELGYLKHRLFIYKPEKNTKYTYHLDGRAGGKKFTSDDEVWQE